MTVVEALPGGGWYSKLLIPYLGNEGELVGANYPTGMYKLFGYDEERLTKLANWSTDWPATAQTWVAGDAASVSALSWVIWRTAKRGYRGCGIADPGIT